MTIHEIEIQQQLETLYAQLKVFDEPLPADVPFEYEVEEFKLWEKLREQIRALEHELAEINIKGESPHPRMEGLARPSPTTSTLLTSCF